MAASDVRNILLRTLFDQEFHTGMVADPHKALEGYNLTDEERSVLAKPSQDLYRYLDPSRDLDNPLISDVGGGPPPPPTTVVVVVVVAIIVTAVVAAVSPEGAIGIEKLRPLLDSIRSAKGQARFDLIRTLTNELTRER
jgi:hypothetical protein